MQNGKVYKPLIGITIGDPAGIGPEIVLKSWACEGIHQICRPIVFAGEVELEQAVELVTEPLNFRAVHSVSEAEFKPDQVNYIACYGVKERVEYGKIQGQCGQAAFDFIKTAIAWSLKGDVAAMVTAPINKESLKAGKVPYLDHTEMLAKLTDSPNPMTLFMVDNLHIFFYSRHLPLRAVPDALNVTELIEYLVKCDIALKQLGIKEPRLALAALNPHGGEHGLFGTEEMEVLTPTVDKARALGFDVSGPIPADSVFNLCLEGHFDGVLSLYHDQGHIAAKTYDFHRTVSLTMGLPFLRTSVDHGTAFEIAGKGIANATGMIEAIKAAAKYGLQVRSWK